MKSHSRGLLAQHPTLETDLEHQKRGKKCVTAFCGKGLISYSHSSCTASLLPSSNTSIPSVYFQHVNQLTTPAAGLAISIAVTYSRTSRQMSILCRED